MDTLKEVSIIVKWDGKQYLISDISGQETVAMLKRKIAKLTNVRSGRQKLVNLEFKGKIASDDLRLSSLELKPHFELIMVEADIQDVQSTIDNHDILDVYKEQPTCSFHKMEPTSPINNNDLKRKLQYETTSTSKKQKTPIGIGDICDDVIDLILYRLELEDLANVSDTNKRLRNIAGSVFSRKYGNHLISVGHFTKCSGVPIERIVFLPFVFRNERMVRIGDARVWYKLLRNFGGSIKYIRLFRMIELNINVGSKWERLLEYVSEYCADSVEVMEVMTNLAFSLNKPLVEIQKFFIHSCLKIKSLELSQNLRALRLSSWANTIDKHFPQLENAKLSLNNSSDAYSLISFLHMNPQIKKLSLRIYTHGNDYIDQIYSAIDENLTQLKKLSIYIGGMHKRSTFIRTKRFKTIHQFAIFGYYNSWFELFEFENDLKKLTLGKVYNIEKSLEFILRHKKLEKLKLHNFHDCKDHPDFRRILRELRYLVKVSIMSVKKRRVAKWKSAFGIEWECMEYETYYDNTILLKFFKRVEK